MGTCPPQLSPPRFQLHTEDFISWGASTEQRGQVTLLMSWEPLIEPKLAFPSLLPPAGPGPPPLC